MNIAARWIRRHRLLVFCVVSFLISWRTYLTDPFGPERDRGLDPFGPLIAAVLVGAVVHGKQALFDALRVLVKWRAPLALYIFALATPVVLTLAGIALNVSLGAHPPPAERWQAWSSLFVAFPIILVVGGPLGEELGWRAFALPQIAQQRSTLVASLGVGLIWAAWHLPLLLAERPLLAPSLLGIVAASVSFAWLYVRSEGSVLLCMLMHAAQNTIGGEFAAPMFTGADTTRLAWIRAALYLVLAIVLVAFDANFRNRPGEVPDPLRMGGPAGSPMAVDPA